MGFWSTVTGMDAAAAATNAVLMEHALSGLKPNSYAPLGSALSALLIRTAGSPASANLDRLNRSSRAAQLNLLAFAMAELDWPPRMPGEKWLQISNPFTAAPDLPETWDRIEQARRLLLQKHPDAPVVPKSRFVFDQSFVPHDRGTASPPPLPSAPSLENESFRARLERLAVDYEQGYLPDEQVSDLAWAEGLLEPAQVPGLAPLYVATDFLDPESSAHLFFSLLALGDDWTDLHNLYRDELHLAVLLQAISSALHEARHISTGISLSELMEAVRDRVAAVGIIPSPQ